MDPWPPDQPRLWTLRRVTDAEATRHELPETLAEQAALEEMSLGMISRWQRCSHRRRVMVPKQSVVRSYVATARLAAAELGLPIYVILFPHTDGFRLIVTKQSANYADTLFTAHPPERFKGVPTMDQPGLERLTRLLNSAVRMSLVSKRAIERELGLSTGYLTRLLTAQVDLRISHLLGIARCLRLPPGNLLALAFPVEDVTGEQGALLRSLAHFHPPSRPQHQSLSAALDTVRELERLIVLHMSDDVPDSGHDPDGVISRSPLEGGPGGGA